MNIHEDSSKLPNIAQCNVYRYVDGSYEFLLLKRADERRAFWQPMTEPCASSEDIGSALKRGLREQLGIEHVKHLSEETYSYEWYTGGERGRDLVFAVEIHSRTPVTLAGTQYNDYAWMPFAEAVEEVKWSGNKEALRRLNKRLETEPRPPEIELNTHDEPANINTSPNQSAPGTFVSQVRHEQLPERTEDKTNDYGLL